MCGPYSKKIGMNQIDQHTMRRGLSVAMMAIAGLAFVGFFVGTRGEYEGQGYSYSSPEIQNAGVPTILSYKDRMRSPQQQNPQFASSFADLASAPAEDGDATDPVLREEARLKRIAGRAYEGAPPTIPHPIDQDGVVACMVCHGAGAAIGVKRAPKISHDAYANCTQCHVERLALRPFVEKNPEAIPLDSSFVGFHRLGNGDRVWDDAPPQIPHTTLMRENCASCHGLFGPIGLRTSHPDRQNCSQCHGVSADFDQRPAGMEQHVF